MTVQTEEQPQAPLASLSIEEQIAYICVDVPGERVNTLSSAMTERFEAIFAQLEGDASLHGVVLYSGKPDNFIAGFDIKELERFNQDITGLDALVRRGHALMARVEALKIPVVAAIDGACLGGGLEVALACASRIATENPKTKLGLPEVMLGVLPGGGGTQRISRLLELQTALDLLLTGKQISAKSALKMGLIDEIVHPNLLLEIAAKRARALYQQRQAQPEHPLTQAQHALEEAIKAPQAAAIKLVAKTPARKVIFDKARQQVLKKSKGHYPAPLKILEVVEHGLAHGFEAGLQAEAAAFVELVASPVAKHLMSIFFMQGALSRDPVVDPSVEAHPVTKLGVLGAGLMGAGIAQAGAAAGYQVRLKDRDAQGLGWGLAYCQDLFEKMVKRRKVSAAQADVLMGQISGTTDYSGFKRAELIIEAVFEDLALKQEVLASVEALDNPTQLFASNTSTIPISQIAQHAKRPENVLGMHYFSPVHKMPLLEIIRTEQTSDQAIATALKVGRAMGKTCIVVSDGPGFFTSRVIGAYINEAGWLLQEGASVEAIDEAMERFGFPVGPLKLVDEVGIDVGVKAGAILKAAFSSRWDAPTGLEAIVQDGRKGRKNGRGFYLYQGQDKGPDESVYALLPGGQTRKALDPELITMRCALAMLNECVYCLQEGIAQSPRDIDVGVIFGLGFPPFRGGILRWADELGVGRACEQLEQLAQDYGARLTPAPLLQEMAQANQRFYP